jgi:hypothetical protein
MAKVFISFIHEDDDYARAVKNFITRILGVEAMPFLSSDKLQVYAGENWMDRLEVELRDAKVILLILSGQSVQRSWVNFEAGAGWIRKVAIIPVCVNGFSKNDLPKPYSSWQAVDLNAVGDDEYLARSVAHYLELTELALRKYMIGIAALGGPESVKNAALQKMAYDELVKDLEGIVKFRNVKAALENDKIDP